MSLFLFAISQVPFMQAMEDKLLWIVGIMAFVMIFARRIFF